MPMVLFLGSLDAQCPTVPRWIPKPQRNQGKGPWLRITSLLKYLQVNLKGKLLQKYWLGYC